MAKYNNKFSINTKTVSNGTELILGDSDFTLVSNSISQEVKLNFGAVDPRPASTMNVETQQAYNPTDSSDYKVTKLDGSTTTYKLKGLANNPSFNTLFTKLVPYGSILLSDDTATSMRQATSAYFKGHINSMNRMDALLTNNRFTNLPIMTLKLSDEAKKVKGITLLTKFTSERAIALSILTQQYTMDLSSIATVFESLSQVVRHCELLKKKNDVFKNGASWFFSAASRTSSRQMVHRIVNKLTMYPSDTDISRMIRSHSFMTSKNESVTEMVDTISCRVLDSYFTSSKSNYLMMNDKDIVTRITPIIVKDPALVSEHDYSTFDFSFVLKKIFEASSKQEMLDLIDDILSKLEAALDQFYTNYKFLFPVFTDLRTTYVPQGISSAWPITYDQKTYSIGTELSHGGKEIGGVAGLPQIQTVWIWVPLVRWILASSSGLFSSVSKKLLLGTQLVLNEYVSYLMPVPVRKDYDNVLLDSTAALMYLSPDMSYKKVDIQHSMGVFFIEYAWHYDTNFVLISMEVTSKDSPLKAQAVAALYSKCDITYKTTGIDIKLQLIPTDTVFDVVYTYPSDTAAWERKLGSFQLFSDVEN